MRAFVWRERQAKPHTHLPLGAGEMDGGAHVVVPDVGIDAVGQQQLQVVDIATARLALRSNHVRAGVRSHLQAVCMRHLHAVVCLSVSRACTTHAVHARVYYKRVLHTRLCPSTGHCMATALRQGVHPGQISQRARVDTTRGGLGIPNRKEHLP
eukprot:134449-Rhodomonas_salina.1